jgi:uncharacterized membrane protein SirB2
VGVSIITLNKKGVFIFDALLLTGILVGVLFYWHLGIICQGKKQLTKLQEKRLSYDGD